MTYAVNRTDRAEYVVPESMMDEIRDLADNLIAAVGRPPSTEPEDPDDGVTAAP